MRGSVGNVQERSLKTYHTTESQPISRSSISLPWGEVQRYWSSSCSDQKHRHASVWVHDASDLFNALRLLVILRVPGTDSKGLCHSGFRVISASERTRYYNFLQPCDSSSARYSHTNTTPQNVRSIVCDKAGCEKVDWSREMHPSHRGCFLSLHNLVCGTGRLLVFLPGGHV